MIWLLVSVSVLLGMVLGFLLVGTITGKSWEEIKRRVDDDGSS